MSLLALFDEPSTAVKPPGPALSLRIGQRNQIVERVVPLQPGKTTIGSSPQCTVQLPEKDARPLQCLVTTGVGGAQATKWGAGVQLNGREFSKAEVSVGDQLAIGDWVLRFELAEGQENRPLASMLSKTPTPDADAPSVDQSAQADDQSVRAIEPIAVQAAMASAANDESPEAAVERVAATVADELAFSGESVANSASVRQPDRRDAASSQLFADRLILELWQTGALARRRARALIETARDARLHARAIADNLAAMEVELDLARAAYDSHAAHHEQLHLEMIERDRQTAERIAPLAAEVEALRSQLEEARTELAEQESRCDELNAALATKTSDADAREQHTAELEQSLEFQVSQATMLSRELGETRTAHEQAQRDLAYQKAECAKLQQRVVALEQELAAQWNDRQTQEHAAAEAAERERRIVELESELACSQERLAEPSRNLEAAERSVRQAPQPSEPADANLDEAVHQLPVEAIQESSSMPAEPTARLIGSPQPTQLSTTPQPDGSSLQDSEHTSLAIEQANDSGTSFIEKYRHLLDDNGGLQAERASMIGPSSPIQLEDEYLSPAQAAASAVPDDDSDEALEAYMASMLQRMRGASSEPLASMTPAPSAAEHPAPDAPPAIDPTEPLDLDSLKESRKQAPPTDIASLREIANASARSAIAVHRQRRSLESVVGKWTVAFVAGVTAGTMTSLADSSHDWLFIAGLAIGVVGVWGAFEGVRVVRRTAAERRESAREAPPNKPQPAKESDS